MIAAMPHAAPALAPRDDGAPLRVAILLFDEVEVLDFAGPFEVFGVARSAAGDSAFEVTTIALRPGPVVARNGLTILPASFCAGYDITAAACLALKLRAPRLRAADPASARA